MTATTTALNIPLIQAAMDGFQGSYASMEKQALYDFEEIPVQKKYITTNEMQMMGAAQKVLEGAPTPSSSFSVKYQKTFTLENQALEILISDDLLEYNLYEEEVPKIGVAFVQSQIQTLNLEGAKILSLAWTDNELCWDNQPVASNEHPYALGELSNTLLQDISLHELSINLLVAGDMGNMKALNGFPVTKIYADHLTVGPSLVPTAFTLIESKVRPGQSSLELNPINGLNYFRNGVYTNNYISPNMYMIRTNLKGMFYFVKTPFKMGQDTNYNNYMILTSTISRFKLGIDNFRSGMFGRSAPIELI